MSAKARRAIRLVEQAVDLLMEAGETYPAHTLCDWLTNEAPDVAR
jgi:hypothetical protein